MSRDIRMDVKGDGEGNNIHTVLLFYMYRKGWAVETWRHVQ